MLSGLKTLIVDDEEVAADMLEIMLNKLGIRETAIVTSGGQAVELFAEGLGSGSPYSLVFLDIIMPGMDGQETLKRMRAAEKKAGLAESGKAVIIMTTALSTTEAMIEALLEGDCTDYLVKPVSSSYLREMLVKNKVIAPPV